MPWPHYGEVSAVERREPRLPEPLDDRQHSGVYEANTKLRVVGEQPLDANVIARFELLDVKRATPYVGEEPSEGVGRDEVIDLNQHGGGDDPGLARALKEVGAELMRGVSLVEESDQRSGIDYERNGGGRYSSWLARRLSSPSPESNTPAQPI